MQQLQKERRRSVRHPAVFVQGRLQQDSEVDTGYVSDLSVEGMRMLTAKAPVEGEEVTIELTLPTDEGPGEVVTLRGQCIWRLEAQLPGYFDCGFRFHSLNRDSLGQLQTLLEAARVRT